MCGPHHQVYSAFLSDVNPGARLCSGLREDEEGENQRLLWFVLSHDFAAKVFQANLIAGATPGFIGYGEHLLTFLPGQFSVGITRPLNGEPTRFPYRGRNFVTSSHIFRIPCKNTD